MPVEKIEYVTPVRGVDTDSPSFVEGIVTSAGQRVILTKDSGAGELLYNILVELRKINLRQQEAFEETINDGDI